LCRVFLTRPVRSIPGHREALEDPVCLSNVLGFTTRLYTEFMELAVNIAHHGLQLGSGGVTGLLWLPGKLLAVVVRELLDIFSCWGQEGGATVAMRTDGLGHGVRSMAGTGNGEGRRVGVYGRARGRDQALRAMTLGLRPAGGCGDWGW
jgi:hypothetical protein